MVQACERGLSSEQPFLWSSRGGSGGNECSRRPWRCFDCNFDSNYSLGAAPDPHHLLSLEAACGLHPPSAVYWAQLTVLSASAAHHVKVEGLPSVFAFQVHSGSFGKHQFLPIDLNLNFLEKLHGERLGYHLLAEAWGLAAVRPPLWTEFPLDRPGAPLPLLTLQGEG